MKTVRLSAVLATALGPLLCACASGPPAESGFCGDGVVQVSNGEMCDDGNTVGGDGCSTGCISEAGAEINCGNSIDDDGDGLIDCADPGCQLSPLCAGTQETLCDNGLDDDQDDLTDCMDPDCNGLACGAGGRVCSGILCQCPTGLSTESSCADGQDDDCDGLVDCLDSDCSSNPACANVESNCSNGLDDDGDGLTDCDDSDCGANPACAGAESDCSNGLDDDGDGQTDCADSDCLNQTCGANGRRCSGGVCACPGGTTESACADGLDNDCDGAIDCADSNCAQSTSCVGSETNCTDGLDNDSDGYTDCADPDCANLSCGANGRQCLSGSCVCPGGSTEICGDGVDNNCDGQSDEGCSTGTCTNPLSPAADCGSGAICMPTPTQGAPGECLSPAGSGTQYSYCTVNEDCAPTYSCVDVGGANPYCLQFCTSWTQCPDTLWEDCYNFNTPLYVYSQEWGACWDGYP